MTQRIPAKIIGACVCALSLALSGCGKKSGEASSSQPESESGRAESGHESGSRSTGEGVNELFGSNTSGSVRSAKPNAMAVNGRKFVAGIVVANIDREGKADPLWPREKDSSDDGLQDIALQSGSATEYLSALFDMAHYGTAEWGPAVDGDLLSTLGKNAVAEGKIDPQELSWCIALNVQDDTPDFLPVLISANFNPALLAPGKFSGKDDTRLPIGPKSGASKSMFGDEAIVIVRKSGAAHVIPKKNLTLTVLYNHQAFDNTSRKKPIKYLTPTGVVTPAGYGSASAQPPRIR